MKERWGRMANKKSDKYAKMYTVELQTVHDNCYQCKPMLDFIRELRGLEKNAKQNRKENSENENQIKINVNLDQLGDLRKKCTTCKCGENGIYKADAIISALKLPVGEGRKSTIKQSTLDAIYKQIDEDVPYEEIANRTGLSSKTIYRISKGRSGEERERKRGRKSTIDQSTIESIYKQIDEGVSYEEIAKQKGVSTKTIYRINKKRTNYK